MSLLGEFGQTFRTREADVDRVAREIVDMPRVLLVGPPGAGKMMIARRVAELLPPLPPARQDEVRRVYEDAGLGAKFRDFTRPPFRAPHHTASIPGLVGSEQKGRVYPGEVTLAMHGVLLLGDLPEFGRGQIEVLAEVLDEGRAVFRSVTFEGVPSRVIGTAIPAKSVGLKRPEDVARYDARIADFVRRLKLERVEVGGR